MGEVRFGPLSEELKFWLYFVATEEQPVLVEILASCDSLLYSRESELGDL
jgi:hypothetical protein